MICLTAFAVFALSVTLGLGALLTNTLRAYGENAERSNLLALVTVAAAGFDTSDVSAVRKCYTTAHAPEYNFVLDKLRSIKQNELNPRFVYLMGNVGGTIVFLADTEPDDSPAYSPPGQVYEEASPQLREAFTQRKGFVEGPFSDAWGNWVSAHAPILDHDTGEVVALLGVDVDAQEWQHVVSQYGRVGNFLTAVATLFLAILAVYSFRLVRVTGALKSEVVKREHTEEGLRAAKRKLTATAQELEAACQQIEADRIELRAANRQLIASQEELARSEEKHRRLTENITDIIGLVDCNGTIQYESPSVYKVLGYTQDERIGTCIFDVIHPDDREYAMRIFTEGLRESEAVRAVEVRYLHKDGTWRVLESRAKNLTESLGLQAVVVTSRDITERKQAEKDIRAAQAMLENILETIPVSVFWKDRDLRYMGCNRRFAAEAGVAQPSDIIGKNDCELPWGGQNGPCRGADLEVLQTEDNQIGQEENWETSKGQRWLRRSIVPLRDHDNLVVGILGTYEDISKERELEMQLRQAQKLEALGTLAGGIAHDFNNILGVILGYSELALGELPTSMKSAGFLKEVIRASKRAASLIQQILAFGRKTEQERKPIRLGHVVAETVGLLRGIFPPTIEIRWCNDSDYPPIIADKDQICQVLMNLCINASHAMEGQDGRLTLALEQVTVCTEDSNGNSGLRPGAYVCLTVEDTGCGMDAKTIERMFEPYFTTKPEGKGSGLGLATVYGIVKSYEGAIDVHSELGKGTTVRVLFPATGDIVEKRESAPRTCASGENKHILLVDDDEPMLGATKALLERMNYRVTAFASPLLALERFCGTPQEFDLVLTDNAMPGMTGVALAEAMLGLRPGLPIVLATGLDEQSVCAKASGIGVRATIGKPTTKDTLAKTIWNALGRNNSAPALS